MTEEQITEALGKAAFFRQQNRLEECARLCSEILNEHIDQPEAIFMLGYCMLQSGKHGHAHALFMQFIRLKPTAAAGWHNLGKCYHDIHMLDQAENCYQHTLRLEPKDASAYANLGNLYLERCEPAKSIEYSQKSLEMSPESYKARHNLGLAQLMQQNWSEGWKNFEASVGYSMDRNERCYADEPRWDGSKGKCIIAYGEQGIGDEISYASCIPDLMKDCSETVIECDQRLEGLFARSFPEARVHGTRFFQFIDWMNQHELEGRVAFGSLPKYYRNKTEDFPGTPYLVADPERRIQWRALLDSLGDKPKVGISWQGGSVKTGKYLRSVSLESMLPIFKQDAIFVSLQYRDSQKDIQLLREKHDIEVHHWSRAAEAKNYDETAALVSELDLVISVTTSVIHLCGALGVPCLVLTPKRPRWFYGLQGGTTPWYDSVKLIRQYKENDWMDPIHEAAWRLRNFINGNRDLHGSDERRRRVA